MIRHAQLLVGNGKYDEALPLLRRAQQLNPRENIQKYLEQVERVAKSRVTARVCNDFKKTVWFERQTLDAGDEKIADAIQNYAPARPVSIWKAMTTSLPEKRRRWAENKFSA